MRVGKRGRVSVGVRVRVRAKVKVRLRVRVRVRVRVRQASAKVLGWALETDVFKPCVVGRFSLPGCLSHFIFLAYDSEVPDLERFSTTGPLGRFSTTGPLG